MTGPVERSRGYLLSFAEVMCELDTTPTVTDLSAPGKTGIAVGGLFIDVTNSGQNYSAGQSLYVVYDSKCLNCSINGTCARKVSSIRTSAIVLHSFIHSLFIHFRFLRRVALQHVLIFKGSSVYITIL